MALSFLCAGCSNVLRHKCNVVFPNTDVNMADEDIDEVDEEGLPTITNPQLWGSNSTQCSLHIYVQHAVWPADTCALLDHAIPYSQ